MRLKCSSPGRGFSPSKAVGIAMMVAGSLMLLIFVPHWVWTGALAILLISLGFLLWRFSDA